MVNEEMINEEIVELMVLTVRVVLQQNVKPDATFDDAVLALREAIKEVKK